MYRTVILPVVLWGCEALFVTLGNERRLSMFENRALRKMFEPKRTMVIGVDKTTLWSALLCTPHQILFGWSKSRRMGWVGHVAHTEDRRGALVGRPGGKRPLGRPTHRWEDNIKVDCLEVRWVGMDWIDRALDRDRWQALVNAVMNLWVPLNLGNFLTLWGSVNFWGWTVLHGVS